MLRAIVLVVLIGIVASQTLPTGCSASTAPTTCIKVGKQISGKAGAYCGWCQTATGYDWYYCGKGMACETGVCTAVTVTVVGEKGSCPTATTTQAYECVNQDYELFCQTTLSNTCGYSNAFAPGETCGTDAALYVNSGCIATTSCSGTTCASIATGSACSSANATLCTPGAYCDLIAGKCTARIASGSNCGVTADSFGGCVVSATCNHGVSPAVCANFGSVADGARCFPTGESFAGGYPNANLLCAAGSACVQTSATSGNYTCQAVSTAGTCTFATLCASNQGVCACDYATGTTGCVSLVDAALATAQIAALSCAASNTCLPTTDFTPGGCLDKHCNSQVIAAFKAYQNLGTGFTSGLKSGGAGGGGGGGGGGSAASSLVVLVGAVSALVALAL